MTEPLPIVIPAAPDSPWLADCVRAARADGAGVIYVVSEEPGPDGTEHVPVHHSFGFALRANRGLEWAAHHGDRALLLNDDTEIQPGTLAALGAALADHPVVGAVLLEWDGGDVQQAGISVSEHGRVHAVTVAPTDAITPVAAIGGAAMALDLPHWQKVRRFDERFVFYMEDIDFCRRAGGAVVVRDARVRHRGGGTRSRTSPEAAYHLGRSHTLLARKLGGGALARARRVAYVNALGSAWTTRNVGPEALPKFLQGAFDGLLA